MEKENKKVRSHYIIWFIFPCIIIITLWVLSYFCLKKMYCPPKDMGSFGDAFGAINSLFSGIALAGIICSIIIQNIEQRKSTEAQVELEKKMDKHAINMEILSELNALNTLLNYHSERIRLYHDFPDEIEDDIIQRNKYLDRIRKILPNG